MLIVGLGNPPESYGKMRHNAGFWMLDEWMRRLGGNRQFEKKFEAFVAKWDGHYFLKSINFMNQSGQSIQKIMTFYKLSMSELVVVYDEMSFSPGVIHFKQGGGSAGHNGVKNIISHMGENFMRIRIGIGRPKDGCDISSYVLSAPQSAEKTAIDRAIQLLVDDAPMILSGDFIKLMNKWNQ